MKKITTLLFIALSMVGTRSFGQDTTKTPDVNNLSAQMWWKLQETINQISKERNYYYQSYSDVNTKWIAASALVSKLQDSIVRLNQLINPVPVNTKLRGLNVHFGKNNTPDYTADKIRTVIDINKSIHANAFRCDLTLNNDGSAKYPIFDQFADSCRKYKMKIMAVISQTSADGGGFAKKYGDVVTGIQYGNELDILFETNKIDTSKAAAAWVTFMNRFSNQVYAVNPNIDAVINFGWNHFKTPTFFKSNVALINSIGMDAYNDSEVNSLNGVPQLGQSVERARKVTGAKKYGVTEIGFLVTKSKNTTQDQFYSLVLPLYKYADFVFLYEALNQPIGRASSVMDERTLGITPASVLAISKIIW